MPYSKEYKPILGFEYPCYICGFIFRRANILIKHVYNIHREELPTRSVGHKRPPDPKYIYQNNPVGGADIKHYSCASCWFHCQNDTLDEISVHIVDVHVPKKINFSKNGHPTPASTPQAEEDEIETSEEGEEDEDTMDIEENSSGPKSPLRALNASEVLEKLVELTDLFKQL